MKQLLLGAALLTLAACASGGGTGERFDWRCDGGAAFSVRFRGESAEVFAGGQVYNLPAAQTGSGARYSNGSVEYREHQGQATLSGAHGGPYTNCRQG
jgi:hypothetical protein